MDIRYEPAGTVEGAHDIGLDSFCHGNSAVGFF